MKAKVMMEHDPFSLFPGISISLSLSFPYLRFHITPISQLIIGNGYIIQIGKGTSFFVQSLSDIVTSTL